jgi:hypothetical protein
MSLLDVVVDGYYQKTDIIIGSKEEVERVQRYVTAEKIKKKGATGSEIVKRTEKKVRIPEQKTKDEENETYYD